MSQKSASRKTVENVEIEAAPDSEERWPLKTAMGGVDFWF